MAAGRPRGTIRVDAVSESLFRGSIDLWVQGPMPVATGTIPDSVHVQAAFTAVR